MNVVATEILEFINVQFRIGLDVTRGGQQPKQLLSVADYTRSHTGTDGKFRALCRLLSVLHPLPKPSLWAIMLEAQSCIEMSLAKEHSVNFTEVMFDGKQVGPLQVIVEILQQTPDLLLQQSDDRLSYVVDASYRQHLLFDIAVASNALDTRQWKASIVIAGSVVEALLLNALAGKDQPENQPETKLHSMSLDQLIKESTKAELIDQSLTDQLHAVRDYRNLIHPGRSIRERETCTLGKAYAMFGVLHLLDEQLSKRGGT